MIDYHLHSKFSHDGKQTINTIIEKAKKLGLSYIAVTDHCDYDYLDNFRYLFFRQIRLKKYIETLTEAAKNATGITVAVGIELGYSKSATKRYLKKIPFEKLDYVINSTHTVDGDDVYFAPYFAKHLDRDKAYETYLLQVEESISAPYPFQTVSHIGYVSKNAPYEKQTLVYEDFPKLFDRILTKIIEKNLTLEVNTNIKHGFTMPHESVLRRYRELGGDNVIFGSDAHRPERLNEHYGEACAMMKQLGFTHWTIYRGRQPLRVKIDG